MLMLIYRISADSAFELLKWRSQETNVKLRVLAEQIVKDFLQLRYDEVLPARAVYDRLLLTAHFRVESRGLSVPGPGNSPGRQIEGAPTANSE